MFKAWQSITLWKRVLVGLFLGLSVGLAVRYGMPDGEAPKEVVDAAQADYDALVAKQVEQTKKAEQLDDLGLEWLERNPIVTDEQLAAAKAKIQPTISGTDRAIAFGDSWFKPFGDLFVRLIKMLIVPLIATTLVAGVTAMGDPKKLGSLGLKTIGLYLLTTLFAVTLGLTMGTIIKPGVGVEYGTATAADVAAVSSKMVEAESAGGFVQRLLEIVPTNPVSALASGDVLPVIFFSIMIGVGILFVGQRAEPIKVFFDAAADVVMKVTMLIMELAPYGVAALMAWVMATKGVEVLTNLFWLAISLYVACILQIVFVYGLLIIKGILRLPLKQFFRGIADAQGVAFSTASSSATLPVSISCAEKNLGVDKSVAGSVLPLGATINMDGTAIYLGLVALFAAQAAGFELTMTQYVLVAMTATLVSIGAAGIPSAGLLLAATVLDVVGVSPEQSLLVIAFIFPFDRLLDMMRTVTNVSGDIAVACTVAKWEGELDETIFRTEAEV